MYGTAKIEKPPRWISVLLTILLLALIFIGFPFAKFYDLNAKWSAPVTPGCQDEANETPQSTESVTLNLPARKCWSAWLVAPNQSTGVWVDEWPPTLVVFWHYADGTTYKQSQFNDPLAPVGKLVNAARFYNTGTETIILPIKFKD